MFTCYAQMILFCFDAYNAFLYRMYTLSPLPYFMCTGWLCTASVSPRLLFVSTDYPSTETKSFVDDTRFLDCRCLRPVSFHNDAPAPADAQRQEPTQDSTCVSQYQFSLEKY